MTPEHLHKSCHDACIQCPQFRPYPYEAYMEKGIMFGDLPNHGLYAVAMFWREHEVLWRHGYSDHLPRDVKDFFNGINNAMDTAIKKYCESDAEIGCKL